MITKLRARNFKSWRDTGELRMAPLTGLFGTNSSGKTSILQLLLMLKQTVDSHDPKQVLHFGGDRSLVDLGTFHELCFAHDAETPLSIGLTWDLGPPLSVADPEHERRVLFSTAFLSFDTEIREHSGRLFVESFGYELPGYRFGMRRLESAEGGGRGGMTWSARGLSREGPRDALRRCRPP
jgi:hypothetical protein